MLYSIVKIIAKLAFPLYCRDIAINRKELLKHKGPLLLAVNHPNSFLDAIILCTLFDRPVYSLARGDAFKNKYSSKVLYLFNMFPVYRVSDDAGKLDENYKTFDLCKNVFKQNGIVLIFSEGRCINEWHLRPLKKGTARLAISSWEEGINLQVLPVAINYSSFRKFGKNIKLYFGDIIHKNDIDTSDTDGNAIRRFNENLKAQLSQYVYEIDEADKATMHSRFYIKHSSIKKAFLFLPAALGFLIHMPFYYFIKWLAHILNNEPGHYDSKILSLLFITYPVFLLLITSIFLVITGSWWSLFLLIILPFIAWAYVQIKRQLD